MKNGQDSSALERSATTRRDFFKLVTGSLACLWGAVFGIPLIGSLVGPALRRKKSHWAKVARVEALPREQPVDLTFADLTEDGYLQVTELHSVWAVKRSLSEVTVFSPICPHLGCQYNWQPQSKQFVCPCHNSVFALDGAVLAGPAPRPLDTLSKKIRNGELFVEWERFKLGIPEKISV